MNVILNFLTFVSSSIRWKSRNIKNFSFDIFDFEKNVRVIVTIQSKHIWFFSSTTHKNWSSIIFIQRYVIIQNLLWSYDLKANVAYFLSIICQRNSIAGLGSLILILILSHITIAMLRFVKKVARWQYSTRLN